MGYELYEQQEGSQSQMLPADKAAYDALSEMYGRGEDLDAATLAYMVLNSTGAHPDLLRLAKLVCDDDTIKKALFDNTI